MELWDVLDEDGRKTGGTIVRGETLKEGQYHLVVHIWIVNSRGEFLIQRRADHLKRFPSIWAVTGGAAIKGEDSKTAAIREVEEELGFKVDTTKLSKIGRNKKDRRFADIWLLRQDILLEDLNLLQEEVSDVAWVKEDQVRSMIESGKFHKYGEDYLKHVFSCI